MKAELLSIGTELLLGDILNTNAQFLSKELAAIGVEVHHQCVIGDNAERLQQQLQESFSRSDVVITTGGLGPTYDDLTKETVASFFGCNLVENASEVQRITSYFAQRNVVMTSNNLKQALIPEGAEILPNPNGTAPGIWLEKDGKIAVLLPGPPHEMAPMATAEVFPRLKKKTGKIILSSTIHLFGIGESAAEARLKEMMVESVNPTIAPYAKTGEVQLRVTAFSDSEEHARAMIDPVVKQICQIFPDKVYGIDCVSLQNKLLQELTAHHLTVSFAENGTGGALIDRFTEQPSSVTNLALVTGNEDQAVALYHLSREGHPYFSEETALEIARQIRRMGNSDLGVATLARLGEKDSSQREDYGFAYVAVSAEGHETVKAVTPFRKTGSSAYANLRYTISSKALSEAIKTIQALDR